jgi:hypothetical protein
VLCSCTVSAGVVAEGVTVASNRARVVLLERVQAKAQQAHAQAWWSPDMQHQQCTDTAVCLSQLQVTVRKLLGAAGVLSIAAASHASTWSSRKPCLVAAQDRLETQSRPSHSKRAACVVRQRIRTQQTAPDNSMMGCQCQAMAHVQGHCSLQPLGAEAKCPTKSKSASEAAAMTSKGLQLHTSLKPCGQHRTGGCWCHTRNRGQAPKTHAAGCHDTRPCPVDAHQ